MKNTKQNMSIFSDGLADAMRVTRESAGLSRGVVAERIGVTVETIAKWERGESVPNIVYVFGFADACDVMLDDIVDFTGADYQPLVKQTSQQRWDAACDREEAL